MLTKAQATYTDTHWQTMSLHALAKQLCVNDDELRAHLTSRNVDYTALTGPEQVVYKMLTAYPLTVTTHKRLTLRRADGTHRRTEVDFLINDLLVIEVQGDYWHSNPAVHKALTQRQRRQQALDVEKRELLEHAGYTVLVLWEHELVNADAAHKLRSVLTSMFAVTPCEPTAPSRVVVTGTLSPVTTVNVVDAGKRQVTLYRETTLCTSDGARVTVNNLRAGDQLLALMHGRVTPVKVVAVDNVHVDNWWLVTANVPGAVNGVCGVTLPDNAQVLTASGLVDVQRVTTVTRFVSWYSAVASVDPVVDQVLTGTLLGDGGLTWKKSGGTAALIVANNEPAQANYLRWKLSLLAPLGMRPYTYGKGLTRWKSMWSTELDQVYRQRFYRTGTSRTVIPADLRLTPLTMAIWYADDGWAHHAHGYLSIKRCRAGDDEQQQVTVVVNAIVDLLRRETGQMFDHTHFTWHHTQGRLMVSHHAFMCLAEVMAPFVHPCMDHKLPPLYRGLFADVQCTTIVPQRVLHDHTVVTRSCVSDRANRSHTGRLVTLDQPCRLIAGGEPGLIF